MKVVKSLEVNPMKVVKEEDKDLHSMLSGLVKLVEDICFTDCKEPLEGFLPLWVKVP